jgi:hypothetical protein
MRPLTTHEQRTIRIAVIAIAIYLAGFYGLRAWAQLEKKRSEYQQLVKSAERLRQELQPYENRTLLLDKLKQTYGMDPSKLSKATLVAQASAAIQKAAMAGGVQLGPIRESAARTSSKELTSMQLEAVGPVPAIANLLQKLETLGYPLILDSVQIAPETTRPGNLKLTLTVVILDFEQWKTAPTAQVTEWPLGLPAFSSRFFI